MLSIRDHLFLIPYKMNKGTGEKKNNRNKEKSLNNVNARLMPIPRPLAHCMRKAY